MWHEETGAGNLGMGCWAIGGPFHAGHEPWGYAHACDAESKRAIKAAYDHGIRLFDTAAVYGAGHSETLLGQVLENCGDARIVTKFGVAFDSNTKQVLGANTDPSRLAEAIDQSRTRLRRGKLDLVLLHLNSLPADEANPLFDVLEQLMERGWIGAYGWSTDYPNNVEAMAHRTGFRAVEHAMNIYFDAPTLSKQLRDKGLTALNRSPLAMGVLSGKFSRHSRLNENDIRHNTYEWMDYFKEGEVVPRFLETLHHIREILQSGGRTPAQGSIAWLWAKSPNNLPIPGARTEAQAIENAGALAFGPLSQDQILEIEQLIERPPEGAPRDR